MRWIKVLQVISQPLKRRILDHDADLLYVWVKLPSKYSWEK